MNNQITELLVNLSKVSSVDKIQVTSEQLNSLEALVVGYMSVVKVGLGKQAESEMLKIVDGLWDALFIKEQVE